MTDNNHPITPPYDQVYKWWEKECNLPPSFFYEKLYYVAKKAARWGADIELDACCEWIANNSLHHAESDLLNDLRAARRPKPPSLAEEALAEIQVTEGAMYGADLGCDFPATRRALERLQELEGQGDG